MTHGAVFDRIRTAVAAVVAAQGEDGAWTDFEIAGMGASGPWVTAAVGLRLAELPAAFRDDAVARAVDRAVGYLDAEPTWSYNHKAPADADTIAHARLLLDAHGGAGRSARGIERSEMEGGDPDGSAGGAGGSAPRGIDALLGFQTLDGGFSTFAPGARGAAYASWSISHPDVTPVAVRALAQHRTRPDVAAALSRALDRRAADRAGGRWPAFWWGLDWYTAAMWARAAFALGLTWELPSPPDAPPRTPLDAAYLLEVALASDWEVGAVADALLAAGGGGPLWPPAPVLRVTAPDVARPWELPGDQGGRLYADVRGIYSTAIIAAALARHAERFATG